MIQKRSLISALFILGVSTAGILSSCSSSKSSSETALTGEGFAESAISSPFASATSTGLQLTARVYGASYAERKAVLSALLNETADVEKCVFDIDIGDTSAYADCYGPNLFFASGTHADGTYGSGNPLPTGDLGLWSSTSATSGEACTAAQINQLIDARTKYAFTSQLAGAALFCFAKTSGLSLPEAAGDITTLSPTELADFGFTKSGKTLAATSATIEYVTDATGNGGYKFSIVGSVADGAVTRDLKIIVRYTENASGGYAGTASYVFRDASANEGNCGGSGTSPSGRMIFYREKETADVQIRLDHGVFCGTTYDPLTADGGTSINPCDKQGSTYATDSDVNGWGGNWNRVVFNYNPDNLVGKYSYAWQAGKNDGSTRVFNAVISDATNGTGYFGFGPDIATIAGDACTESADIGKITKMICNWAGPSSVNANRQASNYVQKQDMTLTSGKWVPVSGTEKIRYFPSNVCDDTGSTALVYCAVTSNSASACPGTHTHTNDSDNAVSPRNNLESLATYQGAWTAPTSPSF